MADNTASSHYTTIVLGAGISGLAAASKLYNHSSYRHGDNTLLVLDARDRTGGRVGSVTIDGHRLDTGANWIHGVGTEGKPNPLMDLLPSKRLRTLEGVVIFSEEAKKAGRDDLVVPSSVTERMMDGLWGTIEHLHEAGIAAPEAEARETTVLEAIQKSDVYQSAFRHVPKEYHTTLSLLPQFIEIMEGGPLVAESAVGHQDSEAMGLHEFASDDFDGEQPFVQDGYTAVADELAKDLLAQDLVRLNTEVTQITWDTDPIRISTRTGTIYTASNVICTLPLGVLQHHQKHTPNFFNPALPPPQNQAITDLAFGLLDKVFLLYAHPWWETEPYLSTLTPGLVRAPLTPIPTASTTTPAPTFDNLKGPAPTSGLQGLAIPPSPYEPPTPGPRTLSLYNLHALTGAPALACFVSCANALALEQQPDAHAEDIMHRTLTAWFGCEPPRPTTVHVTRWATDPWARGSYSHVVRGKAGPEARETLAGRVDGDAGGERGGLRFGGEHTSRDHFATVHGALISGWREADSLLAG